MAAEGALAKREEGGRGVASALCDTPTGKSDDEGGRASYRVLCDYVCKCVYVLLA